MLRLASEQKRSLGHERVHDGLRIRISYWKTLEDRKNWKQISDCLIAQRFGREYWYKGFKIRICLVERDYVLKIWQFSMIKKRIQHLFLQRVAKIYHYQKRE
jgi:hypothetical protein